MKHTNGAMFWRGILLKLVEERINSGQKMGRVPDDTPKLPLQADFEDKPGKLRLAQTAERKDFELDLRKDLDLNRSRFLHRLIVLDVRWGQQVDAKPKGPFKEVWRLRWEPEMVLQLVEKAFTETG